MPFAVLDGLARSRNRAKGLNLLSRLGMVGNQSWLGGPGKRNTQCRVSRCWVEEDVADVWVQVGCRPRCGTPPRFHDATRKEAVHVGGMAGDLCIGGLAAWVSHGTGRAETTTHSVSHVFRRRQGPGPRASTKQDRQAFILVPNRHGQAGLVDKLDVRAGAARWFHGKKPT